MAMKGPLAPWAPGMADRLTELGYAPKLVERHLHLAGGLSRFLDGRGLAADDLSPELVEQFTDALRARNRSWRPTAKSLSWLVDYLTELGVATLPAAEEPFGEEALIERYREYLAVERALEPDTVSNYVRVVRSFLTAQEDRELHDLTAADVSGFMTSQSRHVSTRAAQRLATGLRSFLSFALVEGGQRAAGRGGPVRRALERRNAAPGPDLEAGQGPSGQL